MPALVAMMRLKMKTTELSPGMERVQHLRAAVRKLQLAVMRVMMMRSAAMTMMQVMPMHLPSTSPDIPRVEDQPITLEMR